MHVSGEVVVARFTFRVTFPPSKPLPKAFSPETRIVRAVTTRFPQKVELAVRNATSPVDLTSSVWNPTAPLAGEIGPRNVVVDGPRFHCWLVPSAIGRLKSFVSTEPSVTFTAMPEEPSVRSPPVKERDSGGVLSSIPR